MQEYVTVTGLVLKTLPIGEYDKRVVLLTKEKGKIAAFARGVKKVNSKLMAATSPFAFGEFKLYVGKNSYQMIDASISNYFEELRADVSNAYYGMYFLEIMDYFTYENNDEKELLKLLYQSLRALSKEQFENEFIRCVFEIKTLMLNGEYPGLPANREFLSSTEYTVNFIQKATVEKLYTFLVTEEVLKELVIIAEHYKKHFYNQPFQSLEILKALF